MNCKSSLAVWIEKMLMRSYFCQLKIFSSFSITLPRKNLSQITHKLAFLLLNSAKIFVLCDLPGVYLSLKPPFWKISSSNWIFNIIYYSLNVCTSHHGYHGKENWHWNYYNIRLCMNFNKNFRQFHDNLSSWILNIISLRNVQDQLWRWWIVNVRVIYVVNVNMVYSECKTSFGLLRNISKYWMLYQCLGSISGGLLGNNS